MIDRDIRDTVSSIGIARGKYMLPDTVDGMKHVCYFRHALALDERRVKFLPEYAYGGSATESGKSIDHTGGTWAAIQLVMCTDPQVGIESKEPFPQTKEVWFAGTHSDMSVPSHVQVDH
jgi:uncharacterized protein (DUF2235 family)